MRNTELLSWATSQRGVLERAFNILSLKRLNTSTKKKRFHIINIKYETSLLHQVSGNEEFFFYLWKLRHSLKLKGVALTVALCLHNLTSMTNLSKVLQSSVKTVVLGLLRRNACAAGSSFSIAQTVSATPDWWNPSDSPGEERSDQMSVYQQLNELSMVSTVIHTLQRDAH